MARKTVSPIPDHAKERILSEHCGDAELADLVETYLLTDDQRARLRKAKITVAGMLIGKVPATVAVERLSDKLCREWNAKLGEKFFSEGEILLAGDK